MNTYQHGDLLRIGNHTGDSARLPFTNGAGVATDPTTVVLTVRLPSGTTVEYAWPTQTGSQQVLQKEATGRFYADISLTESDVWYWELAGTGAVETAAQSAFLVERRWVTA